MQSASGSGARSVPATGTEDHARNAVADDRDRLADDRDRAADDRDRVADDREGAAEAREQRLADWEEKLDRRNRQAGSPTVTVRERGHEAAVRARELLATSAARLDRTEAALRRADDSDTREQLAIDREVTASAQLWSRAHDGPAASILAQSAEELRSVLTATALDLAEVEDRVAEHHSQLTGDDPRSAAEHQLLAEHARASAELARYTARRFRH